MRQTLTVALLLTIGVLQDVAAEDRRPMDIGIGEFSKGNGEIPPGWQPLDFSGIAQHTEYVPVRDADTWVVRAASSASASALVFPVQVDLRQYPILRWRWKVKDVINGSDVERRSGDDYAARIYVAFAYDPAGLGFVERMKHRVARLRYGELPGRALNYVWANSEPDSKAFAFPNPYSDHSRLIIRRTAADESGTWFDEERNLFEDFKRAFGSEPPMLVAIGIMTDTDNTGETAVAHFGDITLVRGE